MTTSCTPPQVCRRWCIPSAIVRSTGETLDGIAILDEFPDSLGLVLWQTVDDLVVWACAEKRAELLGLCCRDRLSFLGPGVPDEVRLWLELISGSLAAPGDSDPLFLSRTLLALSGWAVRSNAPRTALAYAQTGALVAPMHGIAALQTARCALSVNETERAETWLRRAIAVARRTQSGDTYANACALLGTLQIARGDRAGAEQSFLLAFRLGRRAGIPLARRDGAFGLLRLSLGRAELTVGDERDAHLQQADRYAVAAFRAHREDQPGSGPVLVGIARHWIDREQAPRAREPLARLSRCGQLTRSEVLAASAMQARALASAGQRRRSKAAESRAWDLLADPATPDDVVYSAVLDLVHAAARRGERDAFNRAARAALRFAPKSRYEATRGRVTALAPPSPPNALEKSTKPAGRERTRAKTAQRG